MGRSQPIHSTSSGNILQTFNESLKRTEEEIRSFDSEIRQSPVNEYLDKMFENLQTVEREVRGMSDDIDVVVRNLNINGR
jgi:uncharacterized protein (UPF0335 family)